MALIQSPHVAAIFWHLLVKHPSAILATAVDTTNSIETFPADGYSTYFTFNYLAGLLLILILSYGLYRFMFNPIIEPRESSTSKSTANPGRVAVLVLGDIGRSPRMQNHAVSFAKANWHVDLIGFRGAELFTDVTDSKDEIHIHYLPSTPKFLTRGGKALFVLFGPLKVVFQVFSLFRALFSIPKPSYILVQNPPSIPTIVISELVYFLRGSRLVIDWHNLGYTLLALRLSSTHPLVSFHRLYEKFFSRFAYAHFCVTETMSHHLIQNYGLKNVSVLMDRPPKRYSPLNRDAQNLFLQTLPETRDVDRSTTKILVTSTSYTADEPLAPLLDALSRYSDTADPALPNILLLITGRGPMQEGYRKMIDRSPMAEGREGRCAIRMLWLQPQDYPKLLACADLGISLHKSSSGMDFPMKVIDLYGCGIPVCAANFDAVGEVIKEGINGFLFEDSTELFRLLTDILSDDRRLEQLREGVRKMYWSSWGEEWDKVALPVFAS